VTINGTSFFSIFYDSAGQIISSHIFNGNLYPTSDDAWDIAVDSSSNVYVVGRGDCENSRCKLVLVKYSKYSGIENISNQIPNNYFLSQNYPNPFNAMTKINFNIPVKTFAKIKIYDISGREIKILLNDCINPGFYSCTFDLSEFSSGIYFYCLQSGNFNETKKLVLIK
jgi:hypothetical protein